MIHLIKLNCIQCIYIVPIQKGVIKLNWKLDDQLCFLLYASSRHVIKAYKKILDPLNLTYTQYITMVALWEKDHQLVSELGKSLILDSGTLTPVLKKLEKDGRVKRNRDEVDQRKVYVDLTTIGKELAKTCQNVPSELLSCVNINQDQLKSLSFVLKDVYTEGLKGEEND